LADGYWTCCSPNIFTCRVIFADKKKINYVIIRKVVEIFSTTFFCVAR
jgi:hypothetical protein